MRKIFMLVLLILLSTNNFAMVVLSPDAIVVMEKSGQFYKLSLSENADLESFTNLESRLIEQKNWIEIIEKGNPEYAKALLLALDSYLPNNELWEYIDVALLRHEDKLFDTVATRAFYLWQRHVDAIEMLNIEKYSKYRENLTLLNHWNEMFNAPSKEYNTVDKAVDELRSMQLMSEIKDKQFQSALMTTIALSTDEELLSELMYDENFDIALASWYGLSRLTPDKVAEDILSHALWRTDVKTFSFSSGCFRSSMEINAGEAAYTLFSKYLSADKVKQLLSLNDEVNTKLIELINKNTIKISLDFSTKSINQIIAYFESKKNSFPSYIPFTENVLEAAKQLSKNEKKDYKYYFANYAFGSKNFYAEQYIEFLLNEKQSKESLYSNVYNSLGYYNWPRNWQHLKQIVDEISAREDYKEMRKLL